MNADDRPHGTTAYRNGCRCDLCRRAVADAAATRRRRLYLERRDTLTVHPIGTHRRIQALVALGWSLSAVARYAEYDRSHLGLLLKRTDGIRLSTAARMARVYDDLSMSLPPLDTKLDRINATRARNMARRNGWPPPLAWDDIDNDPEPPKTAGTPIIDEVCVNRVLSGHPAPNATAAERAEIVRRWVQSGRPVNDLARLTGWKPERYYNTEDAA